uniref:Uncharacterized protein n=1 Tax=Cliftonaea pectinata TaxID=2007206 RepID=A0A1Z1MPW6_9FLOR|nr:hypothetical protein [Cliftonaea pectinata]ARW68098.1 hypothetical protein [Cliftonaea pectinata]
MKISLNLFFSMFQGKWTSKTSMYLLKSKKKIEYNYETNLNINNHFFHIHSQINTSYYYTTSIKYDRSLFIRTINITINNQEKNIDFVLNYKILSKKLLKVYGKIPGSNLIYNEYLYVINKNLIICLGLVKELNSNHHTAFLTQSHIRFK